MKTIKVPLSVAGIDRAIKELEEYQKWFNERTRVFLDRLAKEGCEVAQAGFKTATYDGDNDVKVSVDDLGETVRAVVALGRATLFIEFGSGVITPLHPETPDGLGRGSWSDGPNGKGHWQDPNGWYYAHGKKSRGNPANMAMYEAVKDLENRLGQIAREVFT